MAISAVITADIVNSTLLSKVEERRFKDRLKAILKPNRYEFYRGDSFQAFIRNPHSALRIVLMIRTEARKIAMRYDVRCSIGIGRINPYIKKLSAATDAAFVLSGRSFDTLTRTDQRLIISSLNPTVNHGLLVISYFLDYLVRNLTEKQAEVIGELLKENTQLVAARKLRKSASTINKHAQAAGWHEMMKLLTEYDHLISIVLNGKHLVD